MVRTSPKLRHFLWRSLSGALLVKDRLRSRGILINSTCGFCYSGSETICHVLFTCPKAKEVWDLSQIPLPPAGFSRNSTFLNLHHLLMCSKNSYIASSTRLRFPWILWNLWKARNSLVFDQLHYTASSIISKAKEDADIWLKVDAPELPIPKVSPSYPLMGTWWRKPSPDFVKCNIGASWSPDYFTSGASWIVRDHMGSALCHRRRSNAMFPKFRSLLDEIFSLLSGFNSWSLEHVPPVCNCTANAIAISVLQHNMYQSYIGRSGPAWLRHLITGEASLG
ncbi:unnamed protein product [Microthlaspi erraticum]|uniref:Reverse transcriptase zinc-binding domain-containing protein n=1 Tax=Microthlaspi erraticum TaxID=1685480 RepID=A0A6D2HVK9_9BRAS|nr:unnamed protein product [Microthlaspi erraticum]